jgi:uncharacterized membrane protein
MTILDRFKDGGWGMYPTLVFGLVLLATSVRFAQSSERRLVPLLVVLNWLTLTSGALGFLTGLVVTARALAGPGIEETTRIAFEGFSESLYNMVFALLFAMIAALAATLGAWKIARARDAAA